MTARHVQYLPDGVIRRADPVDLARAAQAELSKLPLETPRIALTYFLGTAEHESAFAQNERDTEPPDDAGNSVVTDGVYQIEHEEAVAVGLPGANLFDLGEATAVMVKMMTGKLVKIVAAAKLDPKALPPDVWAYLSIAHNQGIGPGDTGHKGALGTILTHGLDWAAYKSRNLAEAHAAGDASKLAWWLKVFAYGDACIDGGTAWPRVKAALGL